MAKIARSQVWQWLHNKTTLGDGREITSELANDIVEQEVSALPASAWLDQARQLFTAVALNESYADFLTLPAYRAIREEEPAA